MPRRQPGNRCGGAAVVTDVVPSKSLIATAEMMDEITRSASLGIRITAADDLPDWRSHRVPSLLVEGMTVAGA